MRVAVVGVGNLLLSDEGLGVRAVQRLMENYEPPEGVELIDGGTLGIGLLYHLDGVERLLILDAVRGGGTPGTIYRFEKEEVKTYLREKVSAHDTGIQDILGVLDLLGRSPKEVVLIGMEPKTLEVGDELSPEVEGKIGLLVEAALDQLRSWGIEISERRCGSC